MFGGGILLLNHVYLANRVTADLTRESTTVCLLWQLHCTACEKRVILLMVGGPVIIVVVVCVLTMVFGCNNDIKAITMMVHWETMVRIFINFCKNSATAQAFVTKLEWNIFGARVFDMWLCASSIFLSLSCIPIHSWLNVFWKPRASKPPSGTSPGASSLLRNGVRLVATEQFRKKWHFHIETLVEFKEILLSLSSPSISLSSCINQFYFFIRHSRSLRESHSKNKIKQYK